MENTNETAEMWNDHKKQMENMRRRRRDQFWQVIKDFRKMGFTVEEISPYQYRFNDGIDIYPSNKRYHDLTKNVRGDIRGKTFDRFLREHFGLSINV